MTARVPRLAAMVVAIVVAVNAAGGMAYGLLGADSEPRSWLDGSPFDDYLVPSLVLGVVVGGSQAWAAWRLARRSPDAARALAIAAVVLAGWIAAQLAIIGSVSALQPIMLAVAAVELALAAALRSAR